ncbi:hypothetical protein [Desulfomicrobium baculatum]|uniref:hypothetical protein n=1 Tax=Desulfomicrobium baculatum TaxID=899 RepID=UPI0001A2F5F7|nr:hypothetical protein [Desulfomicrobium baculatum]
MERVELPGVEQAMFIENITLPSIFGNVWVKPNRFETIVQEISGLGCIEAGGNCVKGPENPGLLRS